MRLSADQPDDAFDHEERADRGEATHGEHVCVPAVCLALSLCVPVGAL
jgi:hypothetical protein